MSTKKMFKVITPIVNAKTGKTYWMKLGAAFTNNDNSINVHLDALPLDGKIQLRDWDEEDRRAPAGERASAPTYPLPLEPTSMANDATPF